jgi:hypothetical protein
MARSTTDVVVSWFYRVLGIVVLVLLANLISWIVSSPMIADLVSFLNRNVLLIILISLFFFLGSLFYFFRYPSRLITPIFEALGSALLAVFLINLIEVLDSYMNTGIGDFLAYYSRIIYIAVFIVVLVLGYLYILDGHRYREVRVERRAHHRDDLDDDEVEEEEIIEEEHPTAERGRTTRRVVKRKVRRR